MLHIPAAIVCCVCASPEWVACRPGTAPDATRSVHQAELFPTEAIADVAWCGEHWPWTETINEVSNQT